MSPYVRKVKTASGATAVQIVEKRGGRRSIVEHLGSAHDEIELAVLISTARQRLHGVQDDMLLLETARRTPAGPVVEHTSTDLLWRVLTNAYRHLGFDQLNDEVFTSLVAARIVEPTSKLDTVRVLGELGVAAPHPNMATSNGAETTTLIPVIEAFRARHTITDLVVVADAGMLSAANLNGLKDAGCRFIVGSRQSQAPYDPGDHFERYGNYVPDGSTIETSRNMGTGKNRRSRRLVYHYSFKRRQRDERAINAQIDKAEKVAAGKRPIARDRFVTVTADQNSKKADVNWKIIERARFSAGFKGYVTNIPADSLDGPAVVAAYYDLWRVEESFRMSKNDLQARPIFHRKTDSIDAHLTIVFAALAVARYLQDRTGISIKRLVKTLRPLRTVTISIAGQTVTAQPRLGPDAAAILDTIPDLAGH